MILMLFVGIDVAKQKHDVAVLNSEGEICLKNLTIQNNLKGFTALHTSLCQLVNVSHEGIRIALEDTGHYSFNILASYAPKVIKYSVITPYLSKNLRSLRPFAKQKRIRKMPLLLLKKY